MLDLRADVPGTGLIQPALEPGFLEAPPRRLTLDPLSLGVQGQDLLLDDASLAGLAPVTAGLPWLL